MTAIIETGGKQYRINEGDELFIERLPLEVGDTAEFGKVLAVYDGDSVKLGNPTLHDVKVTAEVIKNGKNKKVVVFKMKAKKTYRKKTGHRQPYTLVKIEKIVLPE